MIEKLVGKKKPPGYRQPRQGFNLDSHPTEKWQLQVVVAGENMSSQLIALCLERSGEMVA